MYEIPRFTITTEQVACATAALERSLNSFDYKQAGMPIITAELKDKFFCGMLAEICFADVYSLVRPKECYGLHGQDKGVDFVLGGENYDVKASLRRANPTAASQLSYILPTCVIDKASSLTSRYFFITIVKSQNTYTAYFAGGAMRSEMQKRKIGTEYKKGDVMKVASKNGISETPVKSGQIRFDATELMPIKITAGLMKMPNFELLKFED